MAVATVTSKGQLTIPKDVRDDMGLVEGVRVVFTRTAGGDYVLSRQGKKIGDLLGILSYAGAPVSVDEMDEAIAAAAAETMQ